MAVVLATNYTALTAQQRHVQGLGWRSVRCSSRIGLSRSPTGRTALIGPDGPQTLVPELQPKAEQHDAGRTASSPALSVGVRVSASKLRRLWDTDFNWRSGLLFFLGSIFFTFSSSAGLFLCITTHDSRCCWMVTYPYAFASTLYTWGAWCSVRASLAALRAAAAQQGRVAAGVDPGAAEGRLPGAARVAVLPRQLTPGMAWALLDLAAMVGIWVGTLLYNSSCITPAVLCTFPVPPKQTAWASHWLITVAANIAGCLFVSGSFACWAAAERTLSLLRLIRLPRDAAYWSFLAYLLGSCGFLLGSSTMGLPLLTFAPNVLIEDWFAMFFGYALGSPCFLIGAAITVVQGLREVS